ncbi:MAG TPA: aromatic amino acid lyase, partial [Thermoanaerobaculia bacterium]|nr:aromatic amino acid lyase [Thermoanaerobaculia bacterium]
MTDPAHPVTLDGGSLTLEDLARVARDPRMRVEIHPEAWARVEASRAQIEAIAARYAEEWAKEDGRPVLEYGVTTGFGEFKNVPIAPDCLEELQR